MSRRLLLGVFDNEHDILGATQAARESGYKIVDVYAPYAVHGLDHAMGLASSHLPRVCFALGLSGAAFKVWFEYWTTATDWPINVGGKPFNSLPAFVPVTFEVMVLFAGVSTVIAFLYVCGLFPGKKANIVRHDVSDHRFVLVLEQSDAAFDIPRVKRLLESFHVAQIEERLEEETAR
ncbi:MAG: DUF3341 domain-containing protein [Acidobacteria bacterium]|nr:DUF3341 domain-containing protein [Acidobacteriota bacterium]MCL5288840.1 DUF3341 domain-containing protein [Acidobacteriota bacterium]